MTPYFQAGGMTLYYGDCREVLPSLAADSSDLLIADPPYGQQWTSGRRRAVPFAVMAGDDGSLDIAACLALALKTMRRSRHAYVFGPADLSALPLCGLAELIWDKGIIGLGDLALPWGSSHEIITFGVYEHSKANRAKGAGNLAARLRRGSIIHCQRLHSGQVALHPTEKPVLLLRQLIESSSIIGERVLDPFAGSGSTLEAAWREGRTAVGIEVEEATCEKAAGRLERLLASSEGIMSRMAAYADI